MFEFCHLCALHHVKYQVALSGFYPKFISDDINQKFTIQTKTKDILVSVKDLIVTTENKTEHLENINVLVEHVIDHLKG